MFAYFFAILPVDTQTRLCRDKFFKALEKIFIHYFYLDLCIGNSKFLAEGQLLLATGYAIGSICTNALWIPLMPSTVLDVYPNVMRLDHSQVHVQRYTYLHMDIIAHIMRQDVPDAHYAGDGDGLFRISSIITGSGRLPIR